MSKSICIGSVVYLNDSTEKYVVTDIVNHEDMSSTCYDREYYLIPLDVLLMLDKIEPRSQGICCRVERVTKLPLTLIEDEAPFEFTMEKIYHVRRKKPKTITIYE